MTTTPTISEHVTEELAKLGPKHNYINLAFHQLMDDDLDALGAAIRGNRSISSIHLAGNPFSKPAIDRFAEIVLESDNRNLVFCRIRDIPPALEEMVKRNSTLCYHLRDRLHHGEEHLSGHELRQLVFHRWGMQNGSPPTRSEALRNLNELFLNLPKSDPQLPADAYIAALFQPDAQGFAPLDNPYLWRDGATAMQELSAVPLKQRFLNRQTDKGSTVLESLAFITPMDELLPFLSGRGIRLGKQDLLHADGKPTHLFELIEQKKNGLETLMKGRYWLGRGSEMRQLYDALPAHNQSRISPHELRYANRASTPGRGR